jgi:hypothetical protein
VVAVAEVMETAMVVAVEKIKVNVDLLQQA